MLGNSDMGTIDGLPLRNFVGDEESVVLGHLDDCTIGELVVDYKVGRRAGHLMSSRRDQGSVTWC